MRYPDVAVQSARLPPYEEDRGFLQNIGRPQLKPGGAPVNGLVEGVLGGWEDFLLPAGVLAREAWLCPAEGVLHISAAC